MSQKYGGNYGKHGKGGRGQDLGKQDIPDWLNPDLNAYERGQARRKRVLDMLALGCTAQTIANETGYHIQTIWVLKRKYKAQGFQATVADGRASKSGRKPLLDDKGIEALARAIEETEAAGRIWTGHSAAQWMSEYLGREVHDARGSEYTRRARLLWLQKSRCFGA